jgi:hypothetical protein
MNAHDDERIDAALEALARPEPPADHVVRVLARTGPGQGYGLQAAGNLQARWVLPVAATVLVALGATWQVGGMSVVMPEVLTTWGVPQEIDRPVLPPQAYWGMDAFEEWKSLRPGVGTSPGTGYRVPGTGIREAAAVMGWVPVPSGLPPIELEPIAPAPIEIAPLAALEPITVEAIPLAPIVIAPVDEQERP